MAAKPTEPGDLRFLDPSLDPQIILESLKFAKDWLGWYAFFSTILEIFTRFPSIEYAVGFDGVDDYVSIPSLEINKKGLDLETNIWISQDNRGSPILSIVDTDDTNVLSLFVTKEEDYRVKGFYGEGDDMEEVLINRIELEEWQKIRIWSDGKGLSIEVDDKQVSSIDDIDLDGGPFKLNFGRGHNFRHFEGMVRNLTIDTGNEEIFTLESGKTFSTEDKTDSAITAGLHTMKKGRFERKFNSHY